MICRRRLLQWVGLMGAALGAGIASAAEPGDAVYAAFLNHIAREHQTEDTGRHLAFVLHPQSLVIPRGLGLDTADQILASLPGADRQASADLVAKLAQPRRPVVLSQTALDSRVRLIQPSAREIDELFVESPSLEAAWEGFFERFPTAKSLMRLSPIGYNERFDEAIFAIGIQCGGLCGSGVLARVRKTPAGWEFVEGGGLWVS